MLDNLTKEELTEKLSRIPLWKNEQGVVYYPLNFLNGLVVEHGEAKDRTPLRNVVMYVIRTYKKYKTVTQEVVYEVPLIQEIISEHIKFTYKDRLNDPVLANTPLIANTPRLYVSGRVLELAIKGVRNFIKEKIKEGVIEPTREIRLALHIPTRDKSVKKMSTPTFTNLLNIVKDDKLMDKIYEKSVKYWEKWSHEYKTDVDHRMTYRSRYDRMHEANSSLSIIHDEHMKPKDKFELLFVDSPKIRQFKSKDNERYFNIKDLFYFFGFSDTTFRKYFKELNKHNLLVYRENENTNEFKSDVVKAFGRRERHISVESFYIKQNELKRMFYLGSVADDIHKRYHRRWPKYDLVVALIAIFEAV